MFWGLVMDPNKCYTQTVEVPFHVSMATLDIATANNELVQVMLCYNNKNYKLCSLKKDSVWQVPLDLNFQKGMNIALTCDGQSHVHLTGYLKLDEVFDLDEEEEEDNDNKKDSEEEEEEEEEDQGIDDDDNDNDEEEIQERSTKQTKKKKLMQKQRQKQIKNPDKQKLIVVKPKKDKKERNKKRMI